jgi:hypothetical protein
MRRRNEWPERAHDCEGFALLGGGRDGLRWERPDGLRVNLAAPERDAEPAVERTRLSAPALLLALIAGGRMRP